MTRSHHVPWQRISGALLASALGFTAFAPSALAQPTQSPSGPPQVDQLVVCQVGDGESGGNDAVPVSIQHLTSTGEVTGQSQIPTQGGEG